MSLLDAVLRTPDLRVVWEAESDFAKPAAIVRDTRSGRLYTWPDLVAWRQPIPGACSLAVVSSTVATPRKQGMLF